MMSIEFLVFMSVEMLIVLAIFCAWVLFIMPIRVNIRDIRHWLAAERKEWM